MFQSTSFVSFFVVFFIFFFFFFLMIRRPPRSTLFPYTSSSDLVFMTAVSPGQAARFLVNRYYPSHDAYIAALADVLKREYAAIVRAGFLLQLDCPDLGSGRNNQFQHLSLHEFRKVAALHVAAPNPPVADLPPDRMRLHVCWGNYEAPHHRDVPLRDILDILLTARPAGLSFE